MYVYIYIYIYVCVCVIVYVCACMYVYIHNNVATLRTSKKECKPLCPNPRTQLSPRPRLGILPVPGYVGHKNHGIHLTTGEAWSRGALELSSSPVVHAG